MRFSRALYEHLPTDGFAIDQSAQRDVDVEIAPPARFDVASARAVGEISLLEIASGGRGGVVTRFDGGSHIGAAPRGEACPCAPRHVTALRRVLAGERATLALTHAGKVRLNWEDVAVARRYESVCRLVLRAQMLPAAPPSALFDGPSFHAFCREAAAVAVTSAAAPSPGRVARNGSAGPHDAARQAMAGPMSTKQPGAGAEAAARSPSLSQLVGTPFSAAGSAGGASPLYLGVCKECGTRGRGQHDSEGDGYFYCASCWSASGIAAPTSAAPPAARPAVEEAQAALPVDGYVRQILQLVGTHRVSIIQARPHHSDLTAR